MPTYAYFCAANGTTLEVTHSMKIDLKTWGEVCELAGCAPGETGRDEEVERIIYPVGVAVPMTNSKLKELGFTKLVKRETGVYENVTRVDGEKKYMTRGDASSVPNLSKRISD